MLTIRFSRFGKTNRAYFRVVLTEDSCPVKGRFVELLGSYDPHSKRAVLKKERVLYWLEKGVKFSDSVHNLLVREEVLKAPKRAVKIKKKIEENSPEKNDSAASLENKQGEKK